MNSSLSLYIPNLNCTVLTSRCKDLSIWAKCNTLNNLSVTFKYSN
uniref:Uncharacterized protein n=1 Tax=Arcella intermedia TaxID=1963864 RepID=A0A6B2LYY6_9EUKA